MSFNEGLFVAMVVAAFVTFALTVGYQSFAEGREARKSNRSRTA